MPKVTVAIRLEVKIMILVPTPKFKVAVRSEVKIVSQQLLKTTEANLTKLHRRREHNEKLCCTQEVGSYAQGQGNNQVRGQTVPKIRSG